MTLTLPQAVKERAKALRSMRYWWAQQGPIACGVCADQDELFTAIREFMDADADMRRAQSELAAGALPNA